MFDNSNLNNITIRKRKVKKGTREIKETSVEEINNPLELYDIHHEEKSICQPVHTESERCCKDDTRRKKDNIEYVHESQLHADNFGKEMTITLSDSNELLPKKPKKHHKIKQKMPKEDVFLGKNNQQFYMIELEETASEKKCDITLMKSSNQCNSEPGEEKKKHKKKRLSVEKKGFDYQSNEPLSNYDKEDFEKEIISTLTSLNELSPKKHKKIKKIKQQMLKTDVVLEKNNQGLDSDCTETKEAVNEDVSDLTLIEPYNECSSELSVHKKKHKKKHPTINEKELDVQNPKKEIRSVLIVDENLHGNKNEKLQDNDAAETDIAVNEKSILCTSLPTKPERKYKNKHKSTATKYLDVVANEQLSLGSNTAEENEETIIYGNNDSQNITGQVQQHKKKKHKNKQHSDSSTFEETFIAKKHKVKLNSFGLGSLNKTSLSKVGFLTNTFESGSKPSHNILEDEGEGSLNENINTWEKNFPIYKNETSMCQDDAGGEGSEHSPYRLQQNKVLKRHILKVNCSNAKANEPTDDSLDIKMTKPVKNHKNEHTSASEEDLSITRCGSPHHKSNKPISPEKLELCDQEQSVLKNSISECERKETVHKVENDTKLQISHKKKIHCKEKSDVDKIRAHLLKQALHNIKCDKGSQLKVPANQSGVNKKMGKDKEKKVCHRKRLKTENDIDNLTNIMLLKALKNASICGEQGSSKVAKTYSTSTSNNILLDPPKSQKTITHFKHKKRKSKLKHTKNDIDKIQQSLISAALKKITPEGSSSTKKLPRKITLPMVKEINMKNNQGTTNVLKKKKKRKKDSVDKMTSKLVSAVLAQRQIVK